MKIVIEHNPSQEKLDELGVSSWSTWGCEESTFDWSYSDDEVCYVKEGEVVVETKEQTVTIKAGDLVYFPKGLSCVWKVKKAISKVFTFGMKL